MKKVIFGIGMMFSGVFGVIGCFINKSIAGMGNYYYDNIGEFSIPVFISVIFIITGLIIGFVGAFEKKSKENENE